jgi:GGDEF domain-containing protein
MSALELVVWSLAVGAVGMVLLFNLAELVITRSAASLQSSAYVVLSLLFIGLLSGLAAVWTDWPTETLRAAQVLIGPLCNALGHHWIRGWLSASQRDGLMERVLRGAAIGSVVAGLLCLTLPVPQQLPAAAAICLLNTALLFWLSVRAFLLGDRLAVGMAVASALLLPAVAGLYAVALGLGTSIAVQAGTAACAVLWNAVQGVMVWLRSHPHVLSRGEEVSAQQRDPVTRLYSGIALVQKLIKAQRRRRRTRRDGAVIAVMVFDVDRIAAQVGTSGVHEMFIAIGNRIQRQVGVVNPVGRYWDRCFVSLVETIHSPAWLRTLGLRVAASVRRPLEVRGRDGEQVEIQPDIGVGVVHLAPGNTPVEDILHDAQRIAEGARDMRSRAATLDRLTDEVVPVELANLGPRRHGHANLVPHAVPAVERAA